ncbi:MAG: hypothetical protein K6G04_09215, partial [Lachnospiraceae bacterium]|nr:hypothetical protein [Lachnospiraceae bacterium]
MKERMTKSIKLRMLTVLLALLLIFGVNAGMSGVTNNQVELSTKLLSDYTIAMLQEEKQLEENMGIVNDCALNSMVQRQASADVVLEMKEAIGNMQSTADTLQEDVTKFATAEMNDALSKAYEPYYGALSAYVTQATAVMEAMERNQMKDVQKEYQTLNSVVQSLEEQEATFTSTLDQLIAHEAELVGIRVRRATMIT